MGLRMQTRNEKRGELRGISPQYAHKMRGPKGVTRSAKARAAIPPHLIGIASEVPPSRRAASPCGVAAHTSQFSDTGTGPRIVLIDSWRTAHRHAREYAVDNRCVGAGADGNHHLTWTLDERLPIRVRVDDTVAPN